MLTTIVAAFIVIGVIVFVHELGHFVAAKLSGVMVHTFSLGLGPKLWGVKRGETDYVVSAIPFGGYVKMAGEIGEESDDGEAAEPPERTFGGKSKQARALIIAAGPAMNFVLAIVIYVALTAWMGVAVLTTRQIGVVDKQSPAWKAGLEPGDVVEAVDGEAVGSWDGFVDRLKRDLGRNVAVTVKRGGRTLDLDLDLTAAKHLENVGLDAYIAPVVDSVSASSPAEQAGLRKGDRIVKVSGKKVYTWQDLAKLVEPHPGGRLEITWVRNGKMDSSSIVPEKFEGVGKLGIVTDFAGAYQMRPAGIAESLDRGVRSAAWMSVQFLKLPRLLLQGVPLTQVIGGPVRIGELAGQTIRLGAGTFLAFIAALSAQLSLINLLPIPVLDGGQLLILGVETAARRPISTRQRIIAQQVGLALLIALMVFVTMVDFSRLLGG